MYIIDNKMLLYEAEAQAEWPGRGVDICAGGEGNRMNSSVVLPATYS